MSKRMIAALCALMMLVAMLTGCAKQETPTTDAPAPTTEANTETPASTESPAEPAQEPVEISWQFDVAEEGRKEWAQWCADRCMELYPYITVRVDYGTDATHETNLQTRVASGNAPNVFSLNRTTAITYKEAGHLADLSGVEGLDQFSDVVKNGVIDGVQYTLPIDQNAIAVFYNKGIFEEYGLSVPTTFTEFVEVCETLKANDIIPLAVGLGENWVMRINLLTFMYPLCIATDPDNEFYVKKMNLQSSFAEDENYKLACTQLWALHEYWNDDPMGTFYADACNLMTSEKAAMIFDGSWIVGTVLGANPDIDLGAFAMPATDDTAPLMVMSAGDGFCVYADEDPAKLDASMKLMGVIASQEAAENWAVMGGGLPILNVDADMPSAFSDCQSYAGDQLYSTAGLTAFTSEYMQIWFDNMQLAYNTDNFDVDAHCAKMDSDFAFAQ